MLAVSKRLKRDRARSDLTYLLKIAEAEPYFQMIWCADRIRAGDFDRGARGLSNIPQQVFDGIGESKLYFQPWMLEDLVNEWLATARPKISLPRRLNCESFEGFAKVYNAIFRVDDTESGFEIERGQDVLQMMPRYAHRQFEWQQGWLSGPSVYRSAFIYGQGRSEAWFRQTHGVTPADLMLFAMAAQSAFSGAPSNRTSNFLVPELGLDERLVVACLRLMSAPLDAVTTAATRLRSGPYNIAAKPSVLRRTPIICFGKDSFRAPLPELLVERATSGLYLDLVKAPDEVRNEISKRFEMYCFELVQDVYKEKARKQYKYGSKKRSIDSPDILIMQNDRVELIIECKATRMTFEARFSDAWHEAAERGYTELAKGVAQIWRHVSHMRRGLLPDRPTDHLGGLVLTMDPWMRMTHGQDEKIFEMARQWCAANDPEIGPDDECPVGFTHIADLESLFHTTDADHAMSALHKIAARAGWGANELGRDEGAPRVSRPFAFASRVADVLPWMTNLKRQPPSIGQKA